MNRKGQIGVGVFLIMFIGVVVGIAILQQSATNIAVLTTEVVVANQSFTFPTNATYVTLTGQSARSVSVINQTGLEVVNEGNYTIVNNVVNNGALESRLYGKANIPNSRYAGRLVNVSYTYQPYGYDTSAGGRTIAGLIIIFSALAIAVVAITPVFREKIIDLVT